MTNTVTSIIIRNNSKCNTRGQKSKKIEGTIKKVIVFGRRTIAIAPHFHAATSKTSPLSLTARGGHFLRLCGLLRLYEQGRKEAHEDNSAPDEDNARPAKPDKHGEDRVCDCS